MGAQGVWGVVAAVAIFIGSGVCEIGGGWLVWKWRRDGWNLGFFFLGCLALIAYGILPTLQVCPRWILGASFLTPSLTLPRLPGPHRLWNPSQPPRTFFCLQSSTLFWRQKQCPSLETKAEGCSSRAPLPLSSSLFLGCLALVA